MSILDDAKTKTQTQLLDGKSLLTEQANQAQAQQSQMQVPVICSTNIAIQATGQALSFILYNQVPDVNWSTGAPPLPVPMAIVNLPVATAKDVMLMLMEIIPMHELKFGEINTQYMLEKGLRETSIKQ